MALRFAIDACLRELVASFLMYLLFLLSDAGDSDILKQASFTHRLCTNRFYATTYMVSGKELERDGGCTHVKHLIPNFYFSQLTSQ